jgi:glycosyltransferase involved in cell wall biosynthesis
LGNTGLRLARSRNLPLVFTHHTMFVQYTHYAAAQSPAAARFVGALAAGFANLCSAVIAPSQSVADLLRQRGVSAHIEIIPTGVERQRFARGDGPRFRQAQGIPRSAFVLGYVGRLAPEKNLRFLAAAAARFVRDEPGAHFLVIGGGPCADEMQQVFDAAGLADRLHLAGICEGNLLADAYHALDVLAFASQSETQGMVLTEAMAAGVPVVALDGPGVRDVLRDGVNGRLVQAGDAAQFAAALAWIARQSDDERGRLISGARQTAERFSMPRQAGRALALYESLVRATANDTEESRSLWLRACRRLEAEWELWSNAAQAAGRALEPAALVGASTDPHDASP